jgi:hypothetical protein
MTLWTLEFNNLKIGETFWDYYPEGDRFVKITASLATGIDKYFNHYFTEFNPKDMVDAEYHKK